MATLRNIPQSNEDFFNNLDKALDACNKYDNVLLVGVLKKKYRDNAYSFLYMHELCNLVKEKIFQKYAKSNLHRSFIN